MSSIVAIVGRPNVGKSTLFNRLIQKREAIVDSESGVTRDRHYGFSYWNGKDFTVIDTGGYMLGGDDNFEKEINDQVMIAIEESDVIIFAVDVDTGLNTMTGGRIKRVEKIVGEEPFLLTYGDGVADIDIADLVSTHSKHDGAITMTAVQPDGRFGTFADSKSGKVEAFLEKPRGDGSWINGGFFVCDHKVFDYIQDGDTSIFEQKPLQNLASDGELYRYRHHGFWKCMDNLRDRNELNEMCENKSAPWVTWE